MSEEVVQQDAPQGEAQENTASEESESTVYDVSKQAAELAERESRISEIEAKLDEKSTKFDSMEEAMNMAKENPTALLRELGIDYNQITDQYLKEQGDSEPTESDIVLQKLGALEDKISEESQNREQYVEEQAVAHRQEAYKKAVAEVGNFVDNNAEEFDLIKMHSSADVVLSVIGESFQRTGKVLDTKEACSAVQKHYEEEAKRYLASEKTLERLGLRKSDIKSQGRQETRPQTLTNDIGTKSPRYNDDRPINREESLEKAASLLRWG